MKTPEAICHRVQYHGLHIRKKKVSHLVQKLDGESSCDFKNAMSFSRTNPIKPDHHRQDLIHK